MPKAARWPLEVHLAPHRDVPDLVCGLLANFPFQIKVCEPDRHVVGVFHPIEWED